MHTESEHSFETSQSQVAVPESAVTAPGEISEARSFLRHGLLFILIGLLLYAVLYIVSEQLVFKYTVHNRAYLVKTAPYSEYDYAILGASRAAVFDYDDMNARLEEITGARILNLSTLGSGITVNRLLLDYFLARHDTQSVVYFLDSFALYSEEWNEERVQDVELWRKAPFDPALARLLIQRPSTRFSVAPGYILGFYKINNPDRFELDISEEEGRRFDRSYRPVKQIDEQRMDYLYPEQIDQETFQRYLGEFEAMIRYLTEQNIEVTVIKVPIPERVYQMIPQEEQFDEAVKSVLQQYDASFHDFALVNNDEEFFFNTDHLNRTGALNFYENYLKEVLTVHQ